MYSIKSILWPFDGSEVSGKALDTAVVVARQFKTKIHALHVVTPVPILTRTSFGETQISGFNIPLYEAELRKAAKKSLETIIDRVPKDIEVETNIKSGFPKDIIADYAEDHEIDLIIMSTHGRSGLSRVMLGSVAEAVIRTSTVPVLVVPVDE